MKLLVIRRKDKTARCCVVGVGIEWLKEHATINNGAGVLVHGGVVSQSDEVLIDPLKLLEPGEAADFWLRDYCGYTENESIEFLEKDVLVLRLNGEGRWQQMQTLYSDLVKKDYFLFSSSYGGDGIKLPMLIDERGIRIFTNKE